MREQGRVDWLFFSVLITIIYGLSELMGCFGNRLLGFSPASEIQQRGSLKTLGSEQADVFKLLLW